MVQGGREAGVLVARVSPSRRLGPRERPYTKLPLAPLIQGRGEAGAGEAQGCLAPTLQMVGTPHVPASPHWDKISSPEPHQPHTLCCLGLLDCPKPCQSPIPGSVPQADPERGSCGRGLLGSDPGQQGRGGREPGRGDFMQSPERGPETWGSNLSMARSWRLDPSRPVCHSSRG